MCDAESQMHTLFPRLLSVQFEAGQLSRLGTEVPALIHKNPNLLPEFRRPHK